MAYVSSTAAGVGASVTDVTFTTPAGSVGDRITVVCLTNGATATWSELTTTDFSSVGTPASGMAAFTRVATGSEATTYTFRRAVNVAAGAVLIVSRRSNVGTIQDITLNSGSGGSITLSAVTAAAANTQLEALVAKVITGGSAWTAPGGMTSRDANSYNSFFIMVADAVIGSGSSGTQTFTTSTGANRGVLIAYNPSASTAASGTASLSLSGSGGTSAAGGGTAALSLTGSGAAKAAGAGSAALSLSAAGDTKAPAAGAAALSLTASGAGAAPSAGSGALSLTAAGGAAAPATGAASLSLTASGTATTDSSPAAGTASLSLSASGAAKAAASATAALSLTASGTGGSTAAGTASLELTAVGTATIPLPPAPDWQPTAMLDVLPWRRRPMLTRRER